MKRIHGWVVPMLLLAPLAACDGDPAASGPAAVQAVSGGGQTGLTETALSSELVARVTDGGGRRVAGVAVAWSVDADGGALSAASTVTDGAGEARARWTLGPAAGSFTARATVEGLPPATFAATAAYPAAAALQVAGGNGQTGGRGGTLADSLAVRVVSAEGRAVPGATVTWSVAGGGAISPATSVTNAAGIAKARWTLGAAGPQSATASVSGVAPAAFSAAVVPVASITFSPAAPVVTRGGTLPLAAVPRDSAGNALSGRAVTWSTAAPEVVTVDAAGVVAGVGRGTAAITATSEGRSGTVAVRVEQRPPQVTSLSFAPTIVDVSAAAATVGVRISARVDAGLAQLRVAVENAAAGQSHTCTSTTGPVDGTSEVGRWTCAIPLPRGAAAGTWRVGTLTITDSAGTAAAWTGAELSALGFGTAFQVVAVGGDATPPALTALVVSPGGVTLSGGAQQRVEFTFTATDAGTGVAGGAVFLNSPDGGGGGGGCTADPAEGMGVATGNFYCSMFVPSNGATGAWGLDLFLTDVVGNTRRYTPEQLQAAGFPFRVLVSR